MEGQHPFSCWIPYIKQENPNGNQVMSESNYQYTDFVLAMIGLIEILGDPVASWLSG